MRLNPFEKPTTMDKQLISETLFSEGIAVDATCGNGYDTVFLAEQVGEDGLVYAFDIQSDAIDNTALLLKERGLISRVRFIQESHEYICHYVEKSVDSIMFNLGYLPGSDKQVVTEPRTTINSIESGLTLLKQSGVMTIVVYPGHDTGSEEAEALENYLKDVNRQDYQVMKIKGMNFGDRSPYLVTIYKKSD